MEDQIFFCRHCRNKNLGHIEIRVKGPVELVGQHPGDETPIETVYFLVRCSQCSDISLLWDWELSDNPGLLVEASICYPTEKLLGDFVPKDLVITYEEAKRVKDSSPTSFAILMRKCLEITCVDKKANGRNLPLKIKDLAIRGIIPTQLAEMADMIKDIGNANAHSVGSEPDHEQKQLLEDFLMAIIEYVYIAPQKLNRLKRKIQKITDEVKQEKIV